MAKKQLKIPFRDGRPCRWVKDDHDEERDNYEFDECLEIHGFVRGRSSAVMILRPANDHGEDFNYAKSVYYQVFLTDSKEVIQNMMLNLKHIHRKNMNIYIHENMKQVTRIRYKTEDNPPMANVPLIGYSLEYDCKVALVYRKGDNYYTNMECDVEYKTSPPDEYEYVYP